MRLWLLVLLAIIGVPRQVFGMPRTINISSETTVADFRLSMSGTEIPEDNVQHRNEHPWLLKRISRYEKRISLGRNVRIDFDIRNPELIGKRTSNGLYEYELFSVRFPYMAIYRLRKHTGEASLTSITKISFFGGKVVVDGNGSFDLGGQLLSAVYDTTMKSEKFLESYEDKDTKMAVLGDKIATFSIVIKSPRELPKHGLSIKGYCGYGGSLIKAIRDSRWYPYDSYSSKFSMSFPYDRTQLNIHTEPPENYSMTLDYPGKVELRDIEVFKDRPIDIDVVVDRKQVWAQYMGPLLVLFLGILAFLIDRETSSLAVRALTYIGAIIAIIYTTSPQGKISSFYPFRVGVLLIFGTIILLKEWPIMACGIKGLCAERLLHGFRRRIK
jgi:hypothetical protein